MRAVLYTDFGTMPAVVDLPEPTCPPDGAIIRVEATGLCRSDWHGWRGNDPDITVPKFPVTSSPARSRPSARTFATGLPASG